MRFWWKSIVLPLVSLRVFLIVIIIYLYCIYMNKKLLQLAQENDVLSLYEYTIYQQEKIPVIIAESVWNQFFDAIEILKLESSICITMEDLMHGRDVFGVVLLHIRARSSCEFGEDTIQSITLEHDQIRTSLEAHLRHFLIDLREQILAGRKLADIHRKLVIIMDRVRCGLARYLNGKQLLGVDKINEFVADLDHDWNTELLPIRKDIIENNKSLALKTVHRALLGLLHKIDTMEKNWIK